MYLFKFMHIYIYVLYIYNAYPFPLFFIAKTMPGPIGAGLAAVMGCVVT